MEGSSSLLLFQATALMLQEGAAWCVAVVLNGGEVGEEMVG
jgi:hypothetical protein